MKKNFCLVLLCLFTSSLFAQTEKDNLLIGGDFNMNYNFGDNVDNVFFLNLNAVTGYFLQDNLVLGGGLGYGLTIFDGGNFSSISVRVFPVFRYYFKSDMPVKFYIDLRPALVASVFNNDFGEFSDSGFSFTGGPGLSVFLSNDISVDCSLNYYRDSNFNNDPINRIGVNVGLQVYINNNSKD